MQNGKLNNRHSLKPVSTELFSFTQLDKISMNDEAFQKEIISSFIEDVNIRFQKLESYFSTWDIQKIIAEAHTIKGAGYSVGAKKIGDEALALEISAKHNDKASAEDRIKKLKETIEETKEVLVDYLQYVG
jgi:HPt (histidine-containing phosphotransfer) domain-containing protein